LAAIPPDHIPEYLNAGEWHQNKNDGTANSGAEE
jgi:hypothetical protein